MIKHDRYWCRRHQVLDAGDHHQVRVHLDMPAAALHTVDRGLETLAADVEIAGAAGREIEPNATHASAGHGIQIAFTRFVVDHRYPTSIGAARFHTVECRGIVSAIYARRHNHHAFD